MTNIAILFIGSIILVILFVIASMEAMINEIKEGQTKAAFSIIWCILGAILVLITLILLMNLAF